MGGEEGWRDSASDSVRSDCGEWSGEGNFPTLPKEVESGGRRAIESKKERRRRRNRERERERERG